MNRFLGTQTVQQANTMHVLVSGNVQGLRDQGKVGISTVF